MTVDGSAGYGITDVVTKDGGKLYLWLPQNSNTSANVSVTAGGTDYTRTWARTGSSEIQTLLRVGNAETPNITGQPASAAYNQGDIAAQLSVAASVTDGGVLSYQWYQNTSNSTTGGSPISGATSDTYTPSTGTGGVLEYSKSTGLTQTVYRLGNLTVLLLVQAPLKLVARANGTKSRNSRLDGTLR